MKSRHGIWIGIIGALLTEGALIYMAARTGSYLIPFTGVILIPILLVVYFTVGWLVNAFVSRVGIFLGLRIAFWLTIILGLMVQGYVSGTPKAMFERLGMKPMPASVREFKWQGGAGIDGYFIYTFKADPDDTKQLIEKLRLELETDAVMQRTISNQIMRLSKSVDKLDSPVIYRRTNPWRIDLIADASHQKVWVFW